MIVDDIKHTALDGQCEISGRLRSERGGLEVERLWFRVPEEYAAAGDLDASPLLSGTLVWCLRNREDLHVDGPVSPRLLGQIEEITAVLRSFFPRAIRPIRVEAAPKAPSAGRELTASFFTRGLDSWFAVLEALEDSHLHPPLTHTVYCPTFNAKGWSPELREAKARAVREASTRVGLELIRLETNVNRVVGHGQFAMAHALGFSSHLIASGDMRGGLIPRGLHPDLDPRFSTERTRIIHYGDASRIQKTDRVARSRPALETLDVCQYDYLEQDRNCGRCEKCLRTMLELHALGALERCPVFDEPLRVANVAQIDDVRGSRQAWLEAQHALGDGDFDRQLAAAVRMVIFRSDLRFAASRAETLSKNPALGEALDPSVLREAASTLTDVDRRVVRAMHNLRPARSVPEEPPRGNTGSGRLARFLRRLGATMPALALGAELVGFHWLSWAGSIAA
jgi:hypothetical protein